MDKCSQIASTSGLHGVYRKNDEFESSVRFIKRSKGFLNGRTIRVCSCHDPLEAIELREFNCGNNQETAESPLLEFQNPSNLTNQSTPYIIREYDSSQELDSALQNQQRSTESNVPRSLPAIHDETASEVRNVSLRRLQDNILPYNVEDSSNQNEPYRKSPQHSNGHFQPRSLPYIYAQGISKVKVSTFRDVGDCNSSTRRLTEPSLHFERSLHEIEAQSSNFTHSSESNENDLPNSDQDYFTVKKRVRVDVHEPNGSIQQFTHCHAQDEDSFQHIESCSSGSVHLRVRPILYNQDTSSVSEHTLIELPEYNRLIQHCPRCALGEEPVQNRYQYSNGSTQLTPFVEVFQHETIILSETSLQETNTSCDLTHCSVNCSCPVESVIQHTNTNSNGPIQPLPQVSNQRTVTSIETSSQELNQSDNLAPSYSLHSTFGEESSSNKDSGTRKQSLPLSIELIQSRPLPAIEDQGVSSLRELHESNRSIRRFTYGEGSSRQTDLSLRHPHRLSGSIQLRPLPPIHENGDSSHHHARNSLLHELSSRSKILQSPIADASSTSSCRCSLFCTMFVITVTFVVLTSSAYAYYKFRSYFAIFQDSSTDSPYDKSKTSSPSSLHCNRSYEYIKNDWFITTRYRQGYECDSLSVIEIVKIQRLVVNGQSCNNIANCTSLIEVYLDIVNLYGKYHFYIDNETNVYTGRPWSCPYISGQLWVAAMVEDFSTTLDIGARERILNHFTNDVIGYARNCGYLSNDPTTIYLNSSTS